MSRTVLIAIAALALSAGAASPVPAAEPAAVPTPSPVPAAAPAAAATVSNHYVIGTQDILELSVFQVPELTRTVELGRIHAEGLTADQLGETLRQKLDGRYLKDPLITVVVKTAAKNRVTVDGAVIKPGVYPLAGPTSLQQAIALANGPDSRTANIHRVGVFRMIDGQRKGQMYDLSKIRHGQAPDPEVRPDDIVVVDHSGTKTFFTNFGSTLSLLALLRPY
jgi:polysaccharide export outer membrane protein